MRSVPSCRSEIRKDYVQDKFAIIAPRRHGRAKASVAAAGGCAFCPASLDIERPVLVRGGRRRWRIIVVPNRYPIVSRDNPKAYGIHEVVVETPRHEVQLEQLPVSSIADLLLVYAERTKAILCDPKIEYVLIFKNTSGPAGASLAHPHSQIFATGFIPPRLLDKSEKVFEYQLRHGRCVYCDVVARERRGRRLVYEDRHVVAFTPFASMHNYELWILPKRHLDNVAELNAAERRSWAKALKMSLAAVAKLGLPYNYYFHQIRQDEKQHLYMKITPRGSVWAGVEIGSGVIVNPIAPEKAAAFYRRQFAATRRHG